MSVKNLNKVIDLPDQTAGTPEEIDYYYYDTHPTKEDLMGESSPQFDLLVYLVTLLRWLYRAENWHIAGNLNIYQTADKNEYPLAPDVAVFKGVKLSEAESRRLTSWKMVLPNRPAPSLVIEIASGKTWRDDLRNKPEKYRKMGVKEYFACDPNDPPSWRPRSKIRLRGWRLQGDTITEIQPDERGWLWSEELDSWLAQEEAYLRLYDRQGQRRLNQAEEAERVKEAAWAKLRELNIDPEKL